MNYISISISISLYTHTHMQWNIIQPLKRERNPAICDNMDEPRRHYVKQNKLDTERQILNNLTHK